MSTNTRVVVMRFVRGAAATVVGMGAAWVIGPDALSIVPDPYDWAVVGIVGPALLAVEKYLRDGGDAAS